jgi:hypothetical protein
MDGRLLIGAVLALVVTAFGGFFIALGLHSHASAPPGMSSSDSSVTSVPPPAGAPPPPPTPPMFTAESVEAEFALSEHADLLTFVKKSFPPDYAELLQQAVSRRNEGVGEQAFGQTLAERLQNVMRGKLKYGAGGSTPTIDRLAANEASLFHALGTEGAPFCLKMLGRDDSPAAAPVPEIVRQLMELGTLYRFQAIAEGMSNTKPVEPLTKDEAKSYEASVVRAGLNFKDVTTGAYLKAAGEPGKPCLTLETLHLAIAKLPDGVRRKIYASMFFAGRG